jgi:hypothetical protein
VRTNAATGNAWVELWALRTLAAREEVLTDYGPEWWANRQALRAEAAGGASGGRAATPVPSWQSPQRSEPAAAPLLHAAVARAEPAASEDGAGSGSFSAVPPSFGDDEAPDASSSDAEAAHAAGSGKRRRSASHDGGGSADGDAADEGEAPPRGCLRVRLYTGRHTAQPQGDDAAMERAPEPGAPPDELAGAAAAPDEPADAPHPEDDASEPMLAPMLLPAPHVLPLPAPPLAAAPAAAAPPPPPVLPPPVLPPPPPVPLPPPPPPPPPPPLHVGSGVPGDPIEIDFD